MTKTLLTNTLLLAAGLLVLTAPLAVAQTGASPSSRLSLNLFRAPSTGLEYRTPWLGERVGFHGGFYPTIFKRDGRDRPTSFVSLGATFYAVPEGSTAYATVAYGISLTDGWDDSLFNVAG
jgi:hypothetical protein